MDIARQFYYFLSPKLRFWARRLFYLPYDTWTLITGKRDPLVPPRGMIFIGSGDFVKQGKHLAELLISQTQLKPEGRVLDVGCGIGRLAVPLTRYLNEDGVYEGFDIVQFGIDWCTEHISSRFPNFRFRCVSLKNDLYNLDTQKEAKEFVFPYPHDYFDSVVLTSVFTHMMPDDVRSYLKQIAAVLRKGGKCMATFFIINDEVKRYMESDGARFVFKYSYDGYYLMHSTVKEANIAFDEDYLKRMIADCGLSAEKICHGRWAGGKDALDFQDVVILTK